MKISQTQQLYDLLNDGKPRRTDQILREIYGSEHLGIARISARIYDVSQKYGVKILSRRDLKNKTLWWYKMEVHDIVAEFAALKRPVEYKPVQLKLI